MLNVLDEANALMDAVVTAMRIDMVRDINSAHADRSDLIAKYGQVWNLEQLSCEFHILAFSAPFVIVRRRVDECVGSVLFQHNPRWYFQFTPYDGDAPLNSLRG